MTCILEGDDWEEEADLDMAVVLTPRSRWSTHGTGALSGDFAIDADDGRTRTGSWDQSFELVVEQTAYAGTQPLLVYWEDIQCDATLDGDREQANCTTDDQVTGWSWTSENTLEFDNPGCWGTLHRSGGRT